MASDSSRDLQPAVSQISLVMQNTTERVEEKSKRTNTDLGQLQAQEGGVYVTLGSSPCICRLSQACILRQTSTKATNNADIFSRLLTRPLWVNRF